MMSFLKLDISKYFYNIDHDVLLSLIENKICFEDFNIIKLIIKSTDRDYIHKKIAFLEEKYKIILPKYEYGKGLSIGAMTNQFLAIFYLYKLHHFIEANLHLKFVCYMDDYIILHQDKNYLIKCLNIIEKILKEEYKLGINKNKTLIVKASEGVEFLGYRFYCINKKTIIKLSRKSRRNIKKGIKKAKYLYLAGKISFQSFFGSYQNYKNGYKFVNKVKIEIINQSWY